MMTPSIAIGRKDHSVRHAMRNYIADCITVADLATKSGLLLIV